MVAAQPLSSHNWGLWGYRSSLCTYTPINPAYSNPSKPHASNPHISTMGYIENNSSNARTTENICYNVVTDEEDSTMIVQHTFLLGAVFLLVPAAFLTMLVVGIVDMFRD